ncbi:S-adenosyl-L-methionine-dependent methyltransferase [Glarea lozoyensis ATCC 20868]|uniref:S-adenosyl-L-methionine-dependent methyltransferase n=1 Tax=Glarea lozoyensis (strain ATCC 20868 / MF5171) TaxID=1116229 RepID=S3CYL6_GLAL2|nr:S-adenosyl-L-methionine-dependent methyltransferase [Glarea lozoyensis ATCC 20868]EPE31357.1 S-adenosyl-L-methionine-dependent methyltransferase [Glarea lozoyensis ATCC 20868]
MHDEEEHIEAESSDGFDGDSAYAGSTSGSLTETLASAIARGVEEHGRTYAAYGNEGMSQVGIRVWYTNGIDRMADAYPSAEVLGLDIAPVQPQWVPPNCRFEIDDIEMPWTLDADSFDFIHARDLLLSVRDWPKLIQQSYDHIKPGGYLELQCVWPKLKCDDGSAPRESGLMEFSRNALDASQVLGVPLSACVDYAEWMTATGFEDVTEKRMKMPSSPWPKDKRMKLIGAFEMHNLLRGISGMSLRMFNKAYGWSQEQIELFLVKVRQDIAHLKYHTYFEFVIVHGRKPGGPTTDLPDAPLLQTPTTHN